MVRLLSMGIEGFSSMIFLIPAVFVLQYILFKQRSFYQLIMALLAAAYLMAVYSVTGLPTAYTLRFDFGLNLIPLIDVINSPVAYIKNTILNILLFMPLGFLLPILWNEYRDVKRMVLTGFMISVMIEGLQIFTFRFTDIDDLITNTLGTALGYGIARIISFRLPLKISKQETVVSVKHEFAILFGVVFLIGFFLKPLVSNVIWEAVLSSAWWEYLK